MHFHAVLILIDIKTHPLKFSRGFKFFIYWLEVNNDLHSENTDHVIVETSTCQKAYKDINNIREKNGIQI